MKLPRERFDYSAITSRRPFKLPKGARLAVWTIVNVEEWSIERNMPRTVLSPPYGQPLQPDLPNWSWHEYGMRVGYWRFLEVLNRLNLKATLAINGSVCKTYPRVAEAALKAGWEFMGHGYIQRPMHHLENQREEIFKAVEAIEAFAGKKPRGWESPGITETYDTIDHLREADPHHPAVRRELDRVREQVRHGLAQPQRIAVQFDVLRRHIDHQAVARVGEQCPRCLQRIGDDVRQAHAFALEFEPPELQARDVEQVVQQRAHAALVEQGAQREHERLWRKRARRQHVDVLQHV